MFEHLLEENRRELLPHRISARVELDDVVEPFLVEPKPIPRRVAMNEAFAREPERAQVPQENRMQPMPHVFVDDLAHPWQARRRGRHQGGDRVCPQRVDDASDSFRDGAVTARAPEWPLPVVQVLGPIQRRRERDVVLPAVLEDLRREPGEIRRDDELQVSAVRSASVRRLRELHHLLDSGEVQQRFTPLKLELERG